jgi:hypothetical protein
MRQSCRLLQDQLIFSQHSRQPRRKKETLTSRNTSPPQGITQIYISIALKAMSLFRLVQSLLPSQRAVEQKAPKIVPSIIEIGGRVRIR